MSNLKWLACSLAFASLVTLATSADAQDYWNVRSNVRCGQTNAYPAAVSYGYRNDVPNYGDFSSRNYYGAQSGYTSVQPYLGQRNRQFQDHRSYSVPSPYGYDDQQTNWGGPSMSGYRRQNSAAVYDSVHGDYHPIPQTQSYPTSTGHSHGHNLTRDRNQFRGYSGW